MRVCDCEYSKRADRLWGKGAGRRGQGGSGRGRRDLGLGRSSDGRKGGRGSGETRGSRRGMSSSSSSTGRASGNSFDHDDVPYSRSETGTDAGLDWRKEVNICRVSRVFAEKVRTKDTLASEIPL